MLNETDGDAANAPLPGADGAGASRLETPEYLPISFLNALVYCRRRFYYEYAWGEMLVNDHVLEGLVRHSVADAGGREVRDDTLKLRRVYVYSERLRVAGFIDVVEGLLAADDAAAPPAPAGVAEAGGAEQPCAMQAGQLSTIVSLYPIEYKKGSARGGGLHDHVQLCAQGLCLEERTGLPVAGGYVFSFGSMHRTWIDFTPVLRAQTEQAVALAFDLLRTGQLPPPPAGEDRKCRECSLEPLCLPREVRALSGLAPMKPLKRAR
jgi:CRISPR-associated exonuclease Cas4